MEGWPGRDRQRDRDMFLPKEKMVCNEVNLFADVLRFGVNLSGWKSNEGVGVQKYSKEKLTFQHHQGRNIASGWINTKTFLVIILLHISLVTARTDISTTAGSTVMLPCHMLEPEDISKATIYWQKGPANKVLLYWKNGKPDAKYQDQEYWNRTHIGHREFQKGNLSLIMYNVSQNDSGEYNCIIKTEHRATPDKVSIFLTVNAPTTMDPRAALSTATIPQRNRGPRGKGRHHLWLIAGGMILFACIITAVSIFITHDNMNQL
ncbi:myelin-oligodendrocyte glycoprotein-like isoform X3 [Stegostoma tigrinum]|uniref:myelin-oligodendrocyte glycoprotein-like isoform X3 n=1 Tax=Stegostoma tigrinum TaxID=3053191 RepID=UPI0028709285|nr:myelin-oligodendrocyte glycoprotein-like isoform X3 [Stegostoma tigrinum]